MIVEELKNVQHGSKLGHYSLHGDPVPWARAGCNWKKGIIYDTQRPIKSVLETQLQEQHRGRPLFSGPLELSIVFYLKAPRSPAKRRAELLGNWHSKVPDLSNLIKFIEDLSKGILYVDDSQISRCVCQKIYAEDPRTEFTLTELK